MATPASTTEFLDLVRKSGIYRPESLEERLTDVPALPGDPVASAAVLVQHGLLTRFQAKLLLTGRYKGFRLGQYVIREQLGQGGMGAVYLAEHETLRRRVALKVLTPPGDDANGKLTVERFLREARAAAALDHPNIVRIHDVARQGDVHFLVMEYVDGQTLDRLLEAGGPVTPSRAVGYIAQAAAGLQHAHEKGFVHRDVKPANLILAKDGTVKILDMGLARSFSAESDKLTEVMDRGAILGTADYIAPEQAMNSPDIDIRADIYSLGATFFALVTGKPPFAGNTTQKLIQHQMKEAPDLAEIDRTFPVELAGVVARMLNKKPDDRFQSPAEVIAALAPWLSDDGGTKVMAGLSGTDLGNSGSLQNTLSEIVAGGTKRIGTRRLPAAKPRANRWVWAAVAAAVLLAGGVTGYAVLAATAGHPPHAGATPTDDPGPAPTPAPPPPAAQPKTTGPAPRPAAEPPAATPVATRPPTGVPAYRIDFAGLPPALFEVRGKQSGAATVGGTPLPAGWGVNHYRKEADADYLVADVGGARALGVRHVGGTMGAQLQFKGDVLGSRLAAGETVTIRFSYQYEGKGVGTAGVQQNVKPFKKHVQVELPPTNGAWRRAELTVTKPDADPLGFIFNTGGSASPAPGTAWLRDLEVWVGPPEPVLYELDLTGQKPFVQRAAAPAGSPRKLVVSSTTGDGKMPANWYRWIESPDTVAEFFADRSADGKPALGTRAVSGPGGVLLTSPEFAPPAGRCRVVVEYQSGPANARTVLRFRPTKAEKKVTWDIAPLPPTGGKWRTETFDLDLKGAAAGLLEVYNGDPGPEAAVRIAAVKVTVPPAAPAEKAIYRLDLSNQKPFSMQGRVVLKDPANPRNKVWEQLSRTGEGALPEGWSARPHNLSSVVEFFAGTERGAMALGMRTVKAPGSGMFFLPSLDTPAGRVRLRFDYLTEGGTEKDFTLRFQQRKPEQKPAWTVGPIEPTGGQWRTAELDVDLRGATGGVFEFHNNAPLATVAFWLRGVAVLEPAADPAPAAVAAAAPAAPPAAAREAAAVAYAFDAAALRPGRYTIDNRQRAGENFFPAGVVGHCWKPESVAEFRAGEAAGSPAVGVTNLNDTLSSQLLFHLETSLGVVLAAGKEYRVRVEYRTANDAEGKVAVRGPGYEKLTETRLPRGSDGWRTAEVTFRRDDGKPVEVLVENTAVGEGNTLWVRKVVVEELK